MNKFRRSASLALAGAICVGLLAGCTTDTGSNTTTAGTDDLATTSTTGTDNSQYNIGVVVKTMGNPLFREVAYGAVQAGAVYGCKITNQATSAEGEIDKQLEICDTLIANNVDALVVTPQNSKGIATAVKAAHQANIPFIAVDTAVETTDAQSVPDCFIGMDNVDAGYAVAKMVAEKIGGEGKVIILMGMEGASTSIERTEGYEKALAEYPGITVVGKQNANYEQAKGQEVTANMLQTNPDIKAILSCNDLMALGAIKSLQESGLKAGEDVIIGSYDISVSCMNAIQKGEIYVTGYHWAKLYGYWGVEMALDYLNGLAIPSTITSPHSEITAETVDQYLQFCQDLESYNFNI